MAEKPPSNSTDTSQAAADSMVESASTLRAKVLDLLRANPEGLTTDEVEQRLNLAHQTASPRMWELHKRGQIGDSGRRRKTRSGRMAIVYRVVGDDEIDRMTKKVASEANKSSQDLIAAAVELEVLSMLKNIKGGPQ